MGRALILAAAGGLVVSGVVVAGALAPPAEPDTTIVLHHDALPRTMESTDRLATERPGEHLAQARAGAATMDEDHELAGKPPVDPPVEPEPEVEDQQAAAGGFQPPPGGPSPTGPLGIPERILVAYQNAASWYGTRCSLEWQVIAAIGRAESDHARGGEVHADGTTWRPILGPVLDGSEYAAIVDSDGGRWDSDDTWDRAVGPMQFLPATWTWVGVDADRDGSANPSDIDDAAATTARYLCAHGGDLSDPNQLRAALLRYNNSGAYADSVVAWADGYVGRVSVVDGAKAPPGSGSTDPAPGPTTSDGPSPAPVPTATPSATVSPTPVPGPADPTESARPTPEQTPATTPDPPSEADPAGTPAPTPEPSAAPLEQATERPVPTSEGAASSADPSTAPDAAQ